MEVGWKLSFWLGEDGKWLDFSGDISGGGAGAEKPEFPAPA